MKPTDIAKEYQQLKVVHKTTRGIADALDVSASTISRYLALLDLPDDIQNKVDAGELPVKQPLKALKRKGEGSPKPSLITEQHYQLLEILAHCRFATAQQIDSFIYWKHYCCWQ
ncbi:MAG: hypothetical protein GY814_19325 [Gammaproteobacteria bacterium]|nr:hypothetical protein [Gammaproteobacteria bacterium]